MQWLAYSTPRRRGKHLFHIFECDGGVWNPRMLIKQDIDYFSFYMISDAGICESEVLKGEEWMVQLGVARNLR